MQFDKWMASTKINFFDVGFEMVEILSQSQPVGQKKKHNCFQVDDKGLPVYTCDELRAHARRFHAEAVAKADEEFRARIQSDPRRIYKKMSDS
jgi:hypothetical protein